MPIITMSHEIEEPEYLCLDVTMQVSIDHQEPWRGSMYSCPSDADWYGYTELDEVVVLSVEATDIDGNTVEVPAKFKDLDPEELWGDEILTEALHQAGCDEESAAADAAEARFEEMRYRHFENDRRFRNAVSTF